MFVVVAYDIADDTRRVRVASEAQNFGERVQWSVFECHLDRRKLADLQRRLAAIIDPGADRVSYYTLCRKDQGQVLVDGQGRISSDWDYVIV